MFSRLSSPSRWLRFRAPLASCAAIAFLGVAAAAPLTPTSNAFAEGATQAMRERIYQEFVPETTPEADFVFADVPVDVSVEERRRIEAEQAERARKVAAATQAPPKYTGGGTPAEWMAQAGIPQEYWGYVDAIVSRESGWNPNATNPSSGACGLVQIYPCSKVAGGYDPVVNLIWGNSYAQTRYKGWANAYNSWMSQHWW